MRGRLVEDWDGSRPVDTNVFSSCVIIIVVFVLVFLLCDFVRGFEKGKVRIVIELGVLKSGKRKRVW
jgi:hypothetical protein